MILSNDTPITNKAAMVVHSVDIVDGEVVMVEREVVPAEVCRELELTLAQIDFGNLSIKVASNHDR